VDGRFGQDCRDLMTLRADFCAFRGDAVHAPAYYRAGDVVVVWRLLSVNAEAVLVGEFSLYGWPGEQWHTMGTKTTLAQRHMQQTVIGESSRAVLLHLRLQVEA
jgi:hypothetical protein